MTRLIDPVAVRHARHTPTPFCRDSFSPEKLQARHRFMLKILYRLDELDSIESNLVAEASNRLEVGEFQLFQLAHRDWFGNEIDTKPLERVFSDYLMENQIPPWVRHYARTIIQKDDAGTLHPYAPEYHCYDRQYQPNGPLVVTGWSKILGVLLLIGVVLLAMLVAAGNLVPEGVNCQVPPCYWEDPAPGPIGPPTVLSGD